MPAQPTLRSPHKQQENSKLTRGEKAVLILPLLFLFFLFLAPLIALRVAAPFFIVGISGFITGVMAARKGYSFTKWWFALGFLGLLFVAFLPFVKISGPPNLIAAQKHKGNQLGLHLSIFTAALCALFGGAPVAAALLFFIEMI